MVQQTHFVALNQEKKKKTIAVTTGIIHYVSINGVFCLLFFDVTCMMSLSLDFL